VSHPSNVFDWVQQFMTRHVIIVGGGFAAPALRGAAVYVTLIDKRNYNLFRPMLTEILINPCLSNNPSWDKGWTGYLAGKNSTKGDTGR
jgi:ASC-1-like (ASCH) protein